MRAKLSHYWLKHTKVLQLRIFVQCMLHTFSAHKFIVVNFCIYGVSMLMYRIILSVCGDFLRNLSGCVNYCYVRSQPFPFRRSVVNYANLGTFAILLLWLSSTLVEEKPLCFASVNYSS